MTTVWSERTRLQLAMLGLLSIALIGFIDYYTGPDISLGILYVGPVLLLSRAWGLPGGIVAAVTSASLSFVMDAVLAGGGSHAIILLGLNASLRGAMLIAVAVLYGQLLRFQTHLKEMVREKTAALEIDIAKRTQVEESLRESELRWRFAVEGSGDGLWDWDVPTGKVFFSTRWKEMLGFSDAEIGNGLDEWSKRVHPDDLARTMATVQAHLEGTTPLYACEHRVACKDGSWKWILDRGLVITRDTDGKPLRAIGTHTDISARKLAETQLHTLLEEKTALLKEVHHRVKNNLQVITSLLRLESARHTQPDTRAVLEEMQGRVRSMALLHEALYLSDTFASVDLGAFLRRLVTEEIRALVVPPGAVHLRLDLTPVFVPMDQAMPCGILVNELVSNSIMHGFAAGQTGEIRIELEPTDDHRQICLRVSDTGVGLPADFEARSAASLGMQLVSDLTHQLGGTLQVGPGPKAVFSITFPAHQASLSADAA
jgi:PAS domain S-box-containing protein